MTSENFRNRFCAFDALVRKPPKTPRLAKSHSLPRRGLPAIDRFWIGRRDLATLSTGKVRLRCAAPHKLFFSDRFHDFGSDLVDRLARRIDSKVGRRLIQIVSIGQQPLDFFAL